MSRFKELFGIDRRSLAIFRITLSLSLLYCLVIRAIDLKVFYTDAGILPRAVLLGGKPNPYLVSLHLAGGSIYFQAFLFLLHFLCAALLLLGWKTRWANAASWFLLVSVQDRNPLILMGGIDVYLRLLLFWGLFLPLGDRFSLDAIRRKLAKGSELYLGWGSAAVLLQCALVYWMTGAYKLASILWRSGDAVASVLGNEAFVKPLGQMLASSPELCRALTYGVLGYEIGGAALLFCPFWTGPIRTFVALGFMFMHLAFYLCINVESFQMISIAAMTLFLPAWFWDKHFSRR